MIYLDSCALVKLTHPEPQTAPLRTWLASRSGPVVSSKLASVEVVRALRRSDPAALSRVPDVLARVMLVPMDEPILLAAANLEDPLLLTLDAIHLATALTLGVPDLVLVTYDKRMDAAARAEGVSVAAPRDLRPELLTARTSYGSNL